MRCIDKNQMDVVLVLIGLVFLGLPKLMGIETRYAIKLGTAGGEHDGLISENREFIERIRERIKET